MTDQEINEAVARKLGWTKQPNGQWSKSHPLGGDVAMFMFPDYCHSIGAAWEIVEAGHIDVVGRHRSGIWSAGTNDQAISRMVEASTAPMAICLAFLKLP